MKTKTNHRTPIRSVTIWLGVLVVCLISVSRAFPHPYDNQAATFFCDTTQVRSENAAANNPFTADAHWKIKNKPSGATRIRIYQGQYFDSELDLSYNRHRYFDARTGSFVSQDPLGLAAGDNVYSYAPNVWGWVDPLGLCKDASEVKKTGRAKNKMSPDLNAKGDHTVIKGEWGDVKGYETYTSNPKSPSGFEPSKRVDITGGPHANKITGQDILTPHVHGKDIPGGVRPAMPDEIPKKL